VRNIKVIRVIVSGFGAAGTTFLLQVFLSHQLGLAEFGAYAAVTSILTVIAPFISIGISGLFLRRACVDQSQIGQLMPISIVCLLATTLLAYILSVLFLPGVSVVQSICLATFYFPFALQNITVASAQVKERYNVVSVAQSVLPTVKLLIVLFSLFFLVNLTTVSYFIAAGHAIAFYVLLVLFKREFDYKKSADFNINLREISGFMKQSVFYALNGTVNVAQIQISTIVAVFLFGTAASGLYSSASTLLTACFLLPNIVFGTYFLPKYHKMTTDLYSIKTPLKHAYVSFAVGLFAGLILFVLTPFVIKVVYPASFSSASAILMILCLSIPLRFFSTALGAAILSEESIPLKVAVSFLSIVIQAIFMYVLRGYGMQSLAMSYVISEFFVAALYFMIYQRYVNMVRIKLAV